MGVRFLLLVKKIGNPKLFGSRTLYIYDTKMHLDIFESYPQKYIYIDRKRTINARYTMLVFIFNAVLRVRHL